MTLEQRVCMDYLHVIKKVLSSGRVRLSEIPWNIRILCPEFYELALEVGNRRSSQMFAQDLVLLLKDLRVCGQDSPEGKEMERIYDKFSKDNNFPENHYVKRIRRLHCKQIL